MNNKQIDYILELSQTLNFNRAAENLFISQPTLSYQVKAAEEEIGFQIFKRSGKGAVLTPAGAQFCITLRNVRSEMKQAIEQGQSFSAKYKEDISIGLPLRSAVHFLPDAIIELEKIQPAVSVTPRFNALGDTIQFLKREQDILFALEEDVHRIPDIKVHPLFHSRIYLVTQKDDPLAQKSFVHMQDLQGRTLMIEDCSPSALRTVQQRIIRSISLHCFNSYDHETTLINIASGKGVCLTPGFFNDHNEEFAWIPFDCVETIPCVLCTHNNDKRESVKTFITILQHIYRNKLDFPI